MKKIIFVTLAASFSIMSYAAPQTCAQKRTQIDKQIEYAKTHGNSHRVDGLIHARDHLDANCTDKGIQDKRAKNVSEKEYKLKKAQIELQEARSEGKSVSKIQKKELKVKQAQQELDLAKKATY